MQTNRRTVIIAIAFLAMLATLIMAPMRPTADAANRIREAYNRAEQPVLKPGSDLPEVEQFARDLKIDSI